MVNNITFGNITTPVVDTFLKVDYALGGGFTTFIHLMIFLLIVGAYYNKYKDFDRGIAVAGFITGTSNLALTIFGYLPIKYIWMSVALFVMAFIFKNMEER